MSDELVCEFCGCSGHMSGDAGTACVSALLRKNKKLMSERDQLKAELALARKCVTALRTWNDKYGHCERAIAAFPNHESTCPICAYDKFKQENK